jgi:hypothetical protein
MQLGFSPTLRLDARARVLVNPGEAFSRLRSVMDLSPSELSHQLDFTAGGVRQLEFSLQPRCELSTGSLFQAQLRVAVKGVLLLPPLCTGADQILIPENPLQISSPVFQRYETVLQAG